MRDHNFDATNFLSQVEEISQNWYRCRSIDLRSKVVDNSNFLVQNLTFFKVKNISKQEFIQLSILSWYVDEEVRWILQSDLQEKVVTYSPEDRVVLSLLLESKVHMELFLLETSLWHTKDFFGNIMKNLEKLDKFLRCNNFLPKVVKRARKRGYHDHGSRVADHKWLPKSDYSLTNEQNIREHRNDQAVDTTQFLLGLLE